MSSQARASAASIREASGVGSAIVMELRVTGDARTYAPRAPPDLAARSPGEARAAVRVRVADRRVDHDDVDRPEERGTGDAHDRRVGRGVGRLAAEVDAPDDRAR